MFKIFLGFLVFSFSLVAHAEEDISTGGVAPTGGLTSNGAPIGETIYDPTGSREDNDYSIDPATASSTTTSTGSTPSNAPTAEEIQAAIENYVIPTNTRNFSLSNLNSQNEASLIISSGNEENNVIFRVIRLISMLVGTVAILLYIVAGYFMIFSQGDDNSLTKGKQILTFTSLGLVIVFGAYMIVQLLMGLIYFTS